MSMDITQPCTTVEPETICAIVKDALLAEGIDCAAEGLSDNALLVMLEHYYREGPGPECTIEGASNGLYRHVKGRLEARAKGQVMDDDPLGVKIRHERNIQRFRRFKAAKHALAAELKAAVEATKDGEPRPVPPTISREALEAAARKAGLTIEGSEP